MGDIIKQILSLTEKDENKVIYLKELPIVGNVKIMCKKVGDDRPASNIEKSVDIFTAEKGGIVRITIVRE